MRKWDKIHLIAWLLCHSITWSTSYLQLYYFHRLLTIMCDINTNLIKHNKVMRSLKRSRNAWSNRGGQWGGGFGGAKHLGKGGGKGPSISYWQVGALNWSLWFYYFFPHRLSHNATKIKWKCCWGHQLVVDKDGLELQIYTCVVTLSRYYICLLRWYYTVRCFLYWTCLAKKKCDTSCMHACMSKG